MEEVVLQVKTGDDKNYYRGGDLINALNHVVGYFSLCKLGDDNCADILEVYAKHLRSRKI